MTLIRNLLILFGFTLLLAACGNGYVFETYLENDQESWSTDSVKTIDFKLEEAGQYDLFFTVKNGLEYPYHNLYVDFKLYEINEGKENLLKQELKEFILFQPKNGTPMGAGSSGWYDHAFPLESAYELREGVSYQVRFQHYMRKEALTSVAAIGFAVAPFKPKI